MKEPPVNGLRQRQRFDETYKRHAVELTLQGDRTVKAVAEQLGLSPDLLYTWRQLYAPRPSGREQAKAERTLEQVEEDNRRLRAEVLRLREREIVLKKSLGILSETPESGMPGSKRSRANISSICFANYSVSLAADITGGRPPGRRDVSVTTRLWPRKSPAPIGKVGVTTARRGSSPICAKRGPRSVGGGAPD